MRRLIKFRGKSVKNGTWVTGSLINNIIVNQNEKEIIDPDTIGQFTGLKDSKNNDVIEGDIIKLTWKGIYNDEPYDEYRIVGYEDCAFGTIDKDEYIDMKSGYKSARFNNEEFNSIFSGILANLLTVEVIGNIYDTFGKSYLTL